MTAELLDDSVSSVGKALAILEVLAASDGRAIGVSDLALVTDMPKSTAHRLLKAMEERGFIGRAGSKYKVGHRCLQLSSVARHSEYGLLIKRATPAMEWLFERTGETIHLAVLDGSSVLILEKINGRGGVRMRSHIGARLTVEAIPVGRALMTRPASAPVIGGHAGQPTFTGVAVRLAMPEESGLVAGLSIDGLVAGFVPEREVALIREAAGRLSRTLTPYLEATAS